MDDEQGRFWLITGPNMAGKSIFLRQAALITLLAQAGSFVPAREATIGLTDRIFTRVGASDDLGRSQSTFMVEMTEAANILNNATPRSLVILDEIGRGTSTYDGLAIAQAIVEYIHNAPELRCKTLFATHYHELTRLEAVLPYVHCSRMDVLEEGDRIVFLHRVVPGGADRSYGIHVADLAGIPKPVVNRARALLTELESTRSEVRPKANEPAAQLRFIEEPNPALDRLAALDIDHLSPIEAITRLYELKSLLDP
jgi:DNA mismatch repair protein MutS